MSNARNLADVISGNYDVPLGALDNVPPSNDASALTTGTLPVDRLPSSGVSASSLTAGTLAQSILPNGVTLQSVQSVKQDASVFAIGGNDNSTFHEILGLTVSITPRSSSSKFLILASVSVGQSGDAYQNSLSLMRNGSVRLANGDTSPGADGTGVAWRAYTSNATSAVPLIYIDSPNTTSTLSYGVWINPNGGSNYPSYINRNANGTSWYGRVASVITVLEIA